MQSSLRHLIYPTRFPIADWTKAQFGDGDDRNEKPRFSVIGRSRIYPVITEERIQELIRQGNENRNLDYKCAFSWDEASHDAKCEIAKDVLAFANTRDGGVILIGVGDKTGAIEGLTEAQSTSFDQTRFNDFVQKYTDPHHTSRVHRRTVDGHRFIVIDVPEFAEVPILCAKDAHSSSDSSKQILKKATLYKRTDKATSEAIADADEMRELLNRGLLRRQDELLKAIRQIILPRESVEVQPETEFKAQIASAEKSLAQFKIESENEFLAGLPHWTLEMQPEDYLPERITSLARLQRLVQESAISLRGCPLLTRRSFEGSRSRLSPMMIGISSLLQNAM